MLSHSMTTDVAAAQRDEMLRASVRHRRLRQAAIVAAMANARAPARVPWHWRWRYRR